MRFDQRIHHADGHADEKSNGDLRERVPLRQRQRFRFIFAVGINLLRKVVDSFHRLSAGKAHIECVVHRHKGQYDRQREQRTFEAFVECDARHKRHNGRRVRTWHAA